MAEPLHADEQGGGAAGGAHHVESQLADGGSGAGGDDDAFAAAADDDGAREGHVVAIAEGRIRRAHPRRILADGQRFAGQQRLVDVEAVGRKQADIRGHAVAGFKPEDIAGDQLRGIDFVHLFVAEHGGADPQQLLQGTGTLFGAPLLVAADAGVEEKNEGDEDRIGEIAGEERQHGGKQEDVDQRTSELPDEDLPPGEGGRPGQFIRAVGLQTIRGLGGG